MDFTIQENLAASEHQRAIDTGMTCIDCHQGSAHSLAPGYLEEYRNVVGELGGTEPVIRHQSVAIAVEDIRTFIGDKAECVDINRGGPGGRAPRLT